MVPSVAVAPPSASAVTEVASPLRRRLGALLGGVVGAVLVGELVLRVWSPIELDWAAPRGVGGEARGTVSDYEPDDELGFKPVIGGALHAEHGALHNTYALAKPPGVRRLLFLGDSVTRRGEIVAGLRSELGDTCQYWNAGVEGYATWQEVAYYARYLADVDEDHVVLTFHLNDYVTTPVTFRAGEDVVAVRERGRVERPISWLWNLSYLYRLAQSRRLAAPPPEERGEERGDGSQDQRDARREVERALLELRDLVHARGAELTVLVLPWLRPREQWPSSLAPKHQHVVGVLTQAGIRHYTFLDELDEALAAGEAVQEKPRDPQHPSHEFGRRMARAMLARGFVP